MKFIITILMTPEFSLATMAQTTTITLADGERLEREWWNQFQNPNINVLEKMIAPGFQSVNSLGGNDRARMISTIQKANIKKYTLSNMKITQSENTLIITYAIATSKEVIEGKKMSDIPHYRLDVWQKNSSGWQIISHANLNPI